MNNSVFFGLSSVENKKRIHIYDVEVQMRAEPVYAMGVQLYTRYLNNEAGRHNTCIHRSEHRH
jgi:hypothetical protein